MQLKYKYKDKNFNNLNGGEKQRVIIARALAQEPNILILDEATSNLDIHHQLDILELLHWLNREECMTVVSVMHDLNMAARFSDKLILLDNGYVVKEGNRDFIDGEYEHIIDELKKFENVSYVMNLKELFERIDK